MTSPSPKQRQRLGIAVAQTRVRAGVKQEELRELAGVARRTLSRMETGYPEVELQSIRKVDAALARVAPQHWHVGKAEEILMAPDDDPTDSRAQPVPQEPGAATSGVLALAAQLLATLYDEGFTAYRTARSDLRREVGNEVLAEVDKQFERLAIGRRDVTSLRHMS